MRCPRCKVLHDILQHVPMGQVEEFIEETNPVYKCPGCRWIFSPVQFDDLMPNFPDFPLDGADDDVG